MRPGVVLLLLLLDAEYATGQVLGHLAAFNGVHTGLLEQVRPLEQLDVVVEFGSVLEAASPGEYGRHRVGRRLLALLVFAVVARDRAVSRFALDRLAIGTDEHRAHQTQRAVALSDHVRLHVAVVVLARPDEAAIGLEHLRDHVVDETMLIPDIELVELGLESIIFIQFVLRY